jgi:hypothetical protein
MNSWEKLPELPHLDNLEKGDETRRRKRLKDIRYILFRLQNAEQGGAEADIDIPEGFVEHWLSQRVTLLDGMETEVRNVGGITTFAKRWDINVDLEVYARKASIHKEWDRKLRSIVPALELSNVKAQGE